MLFALDLMGGEQDGIALRCGGSWICDRDIRCQCKGSQGSAAEHPDEDEEAGDTWKSPVTDKSSSLMTVMAHDSTFWG